MRLEPTPQIIGRADIDIAVAQLEENNLPHGYSLPTLLRETPFAPSTRVACHPKPARAKGGGDGGIRTLDRALQPYNGLANRRLQPLGHVSGCRRYARRCSPPQAPDCTIPLA